MSVRFPREFSLKKTCVKIGERKSLVSVRFPKEFPFKLNLCQNLKRKNLVSVRFPKEFPLKWTCVKKKRCLFGPLFFLKLIYIIDHVYTFIATRGKCAQQLSYGFNILDKLESCPHENQIPYGDMDFSKKVSKVTDFR